MLYDQSQENTMYYINQRFKALVYLGDTERVISYIRRYSDLSYDHDVLIAAIKSKSISTYNTISSRCIINYQTVYELSARYGNIELMNIIYKHLISPRSNAWVEGICSGEIEVLKTLINHKIPTIPAPQTYQYITFFRDRQTNQYLNFVAIQENKLHILKFLIYAGIRVTFDVIMFAALSDNLELFEYLTSSSIILKIDDLRNEKCDLYTLFKKCNLIKQLSPQIKDYIISITKT